MHNLIELNFLFFFCRYEFSVFPFLSFQDLWLWTKLWEYQTPSNCIWNVWKLIFNFQLKKNPKKYLIIRKIKKNKTKIAIKSKCYYVAIWILYEIAIFFFGFIAIRMKRQKEKKKTENQLWNFYFFSVLYIRTYLVLL